MAVAALSTDRGRTSSRNPSTWALLAPEQYAALGWSFAAYQDGLCVALMCGDDERDIHEFIDLHEPEGFEIIDLRTLRQKAVA